MPSRKRRKTNDEPTTSENGTDLYASFNLFELNCWFVLQIKAHKRA